MFRALTRLRQTVRQYDAGSRSNTREVNLFRVHQDMTTALTGCERILRTPCPAGYVGMLRSVLVVWLCFLPFTLVDSMGLCMVPVYSLTVFLILKVSPSQPSPKGDPSPPAPAARNLRSRNLVPHARQLCALHMTGGAARRRDRPAGLPAHAQGEQERHHHPAAAAHPPARARPPLRHLPYPKSVEICKFY